MAEKDPAGGETPEAEDVQASPRRKLLPDAAHRPPQTATGTTFTGWQMKRTKGGWGQHWRKDW